MTSPGGQSPALEAGNPRAKEKDKEKKAKIKDTGKSSKAKEKMIRIRKKKREKGKRRRSVNPFRPRAEAGNLRQASVSSKWWQTFPSWSTWTLSS